MRLRGPVSDCTDFRDKSQPYRDEMEKIAWIIEPSKRTAGFNPDIRFAPPKRDDST